MKSWGWDDTWQLIAILLILVIVYGIGVKILAPKNVDYYYLSTSENGGFCVYAHWTWHRDEIAYCTDDKDRALDFTAKANALMAHK